MSALAHWCTRRRWVVIGAWLLVLVGLGVAAIGVGAKFTNSSAAPGTESGTAYSLVAQLHPQNGPATKTGNIVWHTSGAAVTDPAVRADVGAVLTKIAAMPGVTAVVSPYSPAGAVQLNAAKATAYASVTVTSKADVKQIEKVAKALDTSALQVQVGGTAFAATIGGGSPADGLGVLAALVILLVMFRSLRAAVLPIVTGVVGVASSLLLIILASHVISLSSSTITMGSLVGLGVGIDYALFIVNRHRKALMRGATVPDAIAEALNTSGRSVLFAGGTVVVALLAMTVMGVGILTGMAEGAALTVALTVATAATLVPAMLGVMGQRVLSRRQQRAVAAGEFVTDATSGTSSRSVWHRWAAHIQRAPRRLGAAALLVIVVLAVPALSIRLGSSDASSDPSSSTTHAYYETMANAFGDGFDASLLVVAKVPDAKAADAFSSLTKNMRSVTDVASATQAPLAEGQRIAVATVTPASSAQTVATADLITTLRHGLIPAAEKGTDLQVYVGGTTASSIDTAGAITHRLVWYLALVAILGFLLLAMAFRSILVPLIGALSNLLTAAVGLGVVTAVFQFGWASHLLRVGSGAPIESIIPVLIIGIMSGLSMDYQVFLVSRMHEEWTATRDNARAVRVGLGETGRVIAAAGTIMLCVFASFAIAGQRIIAEIGVGLALAVLFDAFVLRLVLVPSVMHVIGRRNWAYPSWAERFTPRLSIEGGAPVVARDEDLGVAGTAAPWAAATVGAGELGTSD